MNGYTIRTSVPCNSNTHNIWIIGKQFACIASKLWCINGKWILEGANLAELFYSSWNNDIFKQITVCVCVGTTKMSINYSSNTRAKGSYILWEESTNWKLVHMTALILYYYLVKRSYNHLCSVYKLTIGMYIEVYSCYVGNDYVCYNHSKAKISSFMTS